MTDELLLEKYTDEPVLLRLTPDGMLQCGGVVVSNNALSFDAVTHTNGSVHGVYASTDHNIVYFKMADGLPFIHIVARNTDYTEPAIFEDKGIMHIVLSTHRILHHFIAKNGKWSKSESLSPHAGSRLVSCCAGGNEFFALYKCNADYEIYFVHSGKWQSLGKVHIEPKAEGISMVYTNNNIEINRAVNGYIVSSTVKRDADTMFTAAELPHKEDNMANGSIISAKFIEQLNENTRLCNELKDELCQFKTKLESLENQQRGIAAYRDSARQFETQINQLGIRIQELSNRFNAISKRPVT